jgi:hypothetical protein
MPGHIRRHGWRLLVLVIVLSVTFLAQCLAAEVPASPSPEPAELCACTCAPVSTLPPSPVALPVLAFYVPNQLPPLQWVYECENVALPLVAHRVWFTRGPPDPFLSFSKDI